VIVLAPVDVKDCCELTVHAFNLAEKYRCPVFIAANKEIGFMGQMIGELIKPGQIMEVIKNRSALVKGI
jgi:2-oxoglutarate ferredoxin oxidoreductase subunit alpha